MVLSMNFMQAEGMTNKDLVMFNRLIDDKRRVTGKGLFSKLWRE